MTVAPAASPRTKVIQGRVRRCTPDTVSVKEPPPGPTGHKAPESRSRRARSPSSERVVDSSRFKGVSRRENPLSEKSELPFRVRRFAPLLVAVAVASVASASAATARVGATKPPAGLTASGRAVWQFEGLLTATFGTRPVCANTNTWNFTPRACALPNAFRLRWTFIFKRHRQTTYSLVADIADPFAGANAFRSVRVRGAYVRCDRGFMGFLAVTSEQLPVCA